MFVLVRLALQKSCGICFQDGKKISGYLHPTRKLQNRMLEYTRYPPARAKEPCLASFLPLLKETFLLNEPSWQSLFLSPEMEYGLDLYKHCYSRNAFHPNEESRKKEARNLYCLVNRQFLGGYKTLVPTYCTPPSSHPPSSEICLGGRRRQQKGREQLHLQWERFDSFHHILTWQHPANREERAIFFQ